MSAVPANATPVASTMETMKQVALTTANWMGRQVQQFAGKIQEFAMKVVQLVKPFFQNIREMLTALADKTRAFIASNPDAAKIAGIGVPAFLLAGVLGYFVLRGESSPQEAAAANA